MKKPDFFVVGAPKCGTSSIQEYFSQHPDIYMLTKELHYFGSDLHYLFSKTTKYEYDTELEKAPTDKKVGEVAVWYLLSKTAAQEIKDFQPEAKIIIMLRNPVEQAFSLHGQMVLNGTEQFKDFKEAIEKQAARKKGKYLPSNYYCPLEGFFYYDVADFYEQVKRYYDVFGSEKVHVILFDDFKSNTHETFNQTLSFLGLSPYDGIDFKQYNPRQTVRSKTLRSFIQQPAPAIKTIVKTAIPSKPFREKIKAKLWKVNTQKDTAELDDELRTTLVKKFKPNIQELSKLIEEDLSHWLK